MLRYFLLCTLLLHTALTVPVPQQNDIGGSPILIVTPQAQVHLDPIPTAYIHHLSPLARLVAPHEETIVYVPANSVASVSAVSPVVEPVSVVARSSAAEIPKLALSDSGKQWGNISQQIEQVQQAIQSGITNPPALSEAAAAAAAAAASAGAGFVPPAFNPPIVRLDTVAGPAKPEALALLAASAPAPSQLPADARHLYLLPAAASHIVDGPVLVAPLSAIRARSLQELKEPQADKADKADSLKEEQKEEKPLAAPLEALLDEKKETGEKEILSRSVEEEKAVQPEQREIAATDAEKALLLDAKPAASNELANTASDASALADAAPDAAPEAELASKAASDIGRLSDSAPEASSSDASLAAAAAAPAFASASADSSAALAPALASAPAAAAAESAGPQLKSVEGVVQTPVEGIVQVPVEGVVQSPNENVPVVVNAVSQS